MLFKMQNLHEPHPYLFLRLVPCKICESGQLSTHAYGDPVKTNSAPTDPSTVLLILFFLPASIFSQGCNGHYNATLAYTCSHKA
jgi:hypothetical protein